MVRLGKKKAAGSEAPWDPFWSYMMGEEETKQKRSWGMKKKETRNESSFAAFFSDDRNAQSSSRQGMFADRSGSNSKRQVFGRKKEKDQTWAFFDNESLVDEESVLSFLDQPYKIAEADSKQQKNREPEKKAEIVQHDTVNTTIKFKPKTTKQAKEETSWLDMFSLTDEAASSKPNTILMSKCSKESQSIVTSSSFLNLPYQMSETEWKRQRNLEKKENKKRLQQEKKAQRAASKSKIKLRKKKKKGKNDEISWLALFPSGDEGEKRRMARFKSKAAGNDSRSIISSGSWFQGNESNVPAKKKSPGKRGSGNRSERGWDGLVSKFESWTSWIESDDDYSTGSSGAYTDSEQYSTSVEEESQSESVSFTTGSDDEESMTNQYGVEYPPSLHPRKSMSILKASAKTHEVNEVREKFVPIIMQEDPLQSYVIDEKHVGGCHDGLFKGIYRDDDYANDDSTTSEVAEYQARETTSPRSLPEEQFVPPDPWDTTILPVGEDLDERDLPSFAYSLGPSLRPVCCSIKSLTPEQLRLAQSTGIPIHELNQAELMAIFPKLRSVNNDELSKDRSFVIGNSNSFEKDMPAHVQATLERMGPQSLYEYEYESAVQKVLVYENFGCNPREQLKLHTGDGPPTALIDTDRVLVQVEVRLAYPLCIPSSDFITYLNIYHILQASTVSTTDCMTRRGDLLGKTHVPLPNSPGVDVAGVLFRIDANMERKHNLYKGERVLSLTKWGGNSRFLTVKPEELVRLPDSVDPAEAACLPETYLSIFQVLHHSQSSSKRYRPNALAGKSFLVVGNLQWNFGRAIGQLAQIGGAENVYATAKPKHVQKLCSLGILPVGNDPLDWCARLQGKVDIIISLDEPLTPLHYKALKSSGQVIVMAQGKEELVEADTPPSLMCARNKIPARDYGHYYDVFTEWERNLKRSKADLTYLVGLLQERKIPPYILDRIPLHKVPKAHEMMEQKRLPGFIVCEPWLVSKTRAVSL
jgi:NADPH:quinone reductase-like Zn-dependent oxidoreductase